MTSGFGRGNGTWLLVWGGQVLLWGFWTSASLDVLWDGFQQPFSEARALLLGPQAPGPSMSFPTVMMWCVGTMSSLVATMTRRSGSGTAGDKHGLCVVEAWGQASCVLFPFSGHAATEAPQGSAKCGPLKAPLPLGTYSTFLVTLGAAAGLSLGFTNQNGGSPFSM